LRRLVIGYLDLSDRRDRNLLQASAAWSCPVQGRPLPEDEANARDQLHVQMGNKSSRRAGPRSRADPVRWRRLTMVLRHHSATACCCFNHNVPNLALVSQLRGGNPSPVCNPCVYGLNAICPVLFIDHGKCFSPRLWLPARAERAVGPRNVQTNPCARRGQRKTRDGTIAACATRRPAAAPFRKTVRCNMHCKGLDGWITGRKTLSVGHARQSAVLFEVEAPAECGPHGSR